MDPKNAAQLDPKLKEIYDRVMGTSTTPSSSTATPQPTTPVPPPPPAQEAPIEPPPAIPPSPPPNPEPPVTPQDNPPSSSNPPTPPSMSNPSEQPSEIPSSEKPPETPVAEEVNSTIPISSQPISQRPDNNSLVQFPPQAVTMAKSQEKPKISPVVWFLGIFIFLIVYAFIWIKVFNLKLPFLP